MREGEDEDGLGVGVGVDVPGVEVVFAGVEAEAVREQEGVAVVRVAVGLAEDEVFVVARRAALVPLLSATKLWSHDSTVPLQVACSSNQYRHSS